MTTATVEISPSNWKRVLTNRRRRFEGEIFSARGLNMFKRIVYGGHAYKLLKENQIASFQKGERETFYFRGNIYFCQHCSDYFFKPTNTIGTFVKLQHTDELEMLKGGNHVQAQ